jgi:hypothetical protein
MSEQVVFNSEEEFELYLCAHAAAFEAAGLENFARRLKERSGDAFAAGRDERASILRDVMREAEAIAKEARRKQQQKKAELDALRGGGEESK